MLSPMEESPMESRTESKTFHYRTRTTWRTARQGVLSASGRSDVVVGSPPEWKGTPDVWAPEELLVASVNTCMMLTFLTLAQPRGVTVAGYDSDAEGTLEKVGGVYQMTAITVRPRVVIASDDQRELARHAMEKVEAHCFMSQSVKAKVTIVPEFAVGSPSR
jgi:organic hydroperoxide reductase OsmC/OhrA